MVACLSFRSTTFITLPSHIPSYNKLCNNSIRHKQIATCSSHNGALYVVAQTKSVSVPFLERPKNLDGKAPGDVGFDPLYISDLVDIQWLRESEIKHGRICMLAALGFIVQEFIHLPGQGKMTPLDMFSDPNRKPGDFGFDPLGLGKNPEARKRYQLAEIKNGRLAMLAVGGFVHHMLLTHQGVIEQLTHFRSLPLS
eukprot:jgi/Galph1/1913/GphlegSOOS_G621.1